MLCINLFSKVLLIGWIFLFLEYLCFQQVITGIVALAFELMHSLKPRINIKKGWLSLKLDKNKAFDKVEWSFIDIDMKKMGFNDRWRHLVSDFIFPCGFSLPLIGIQEAAWLHTEDSDKPILFSHNPFYSVQRACHHCSTKRRRMVISNALLVLRGVSALVTYFSHTILYYIVERMRGTATWFFQSFSDILKLSCNLLKWKSRL